jgi:outer membrane protein assembly factor BamB
MKSPGTRILLALLVSASGLTASADDWPQWLGPNRDSIWRETGIVREFPTNGPAVLWRRNIGAGFSGPAVANGRVYVMDRILAKDASNPSDPFERGIIKGNERILCLDEKTGSIAWTREYDCPYSVSYAAGPRATPTVNGGKVYTLGTEGNLLCHDAKTGKPVWSHDCKKEYGVATPMWGFTSHPLIDGNRLITLVGGTNTTAVAFNKDTGKELWHALTAKEPGYAPPTMIQVGGKPQLIIWHPESINGLNPATGSVIWSQPWEIKAGMSIATPRQVGDLLYLSCFYNGSMMLRLAAGKAPNIVWQSKKISERDTDALHCTMNSPFIEDGTIYGACSYGQLRALKLGDGSRLWETMGATTRDGREQRWGNAFLVKNGDRYFIFNELGDLIIAKLGPKGYEQISRAHILDPTNRDPGRLVVWSHPAFANKHMYARNDSEIICVNLAQ